MADDELRPAVDGDAYEGESANDDAVDEHEPADWPDDGTLVRIRLET